MLLSAVASALLVFILLSTTSTSATVMVSSTRDNGRDVINVDGELTIADGESFADIAPRFRSAVVSFNSDGGSVVAGILIGETIRKQRFDTIVKTGKSCASACALAWLAGADRFIEGDGRVGFHAAFDSTSGRETGVGNALVGAYVTKLGLSYNAVIYITKATPNEMTWLNISDAAAVGIRVALAHRATAKTVLSLPTRFGNVDVVNLADQCCSSQIRYKSSRINVFMNEHGYAHLEAVFRVAAGDLLIISTPSNVRGMAPTYYAVLVTPQDAVDIGGDGFGTSDWTFRFEQVGDGVQFDLGYENRRRKNAIYRDGAITVRLGALSSSATLPKADCARVLNMAAECPQINPDCTDEAIWSTFAMAGQRYMNSLENMPMFSTEKFYQVCQQFCRSKAYSLQTARPLLCGY